MRVGEYWYIRHTVKGPLLVGEKSYAGLGDHAWSRGIVDITRFPERALAKANLKMLRETFAGHKKKFKLVHVKVNKSA